MSGFDSRRLFLLLGVVFAALAVPALALTVKARATDKWLGENRVLQESESPGKSSSRVWWLNSGAIFTVKKGTGSTLVGDLPPSNKWRKEYARTSYLDTNGGRRPQNLFRLVSRANLPSSTRQQCYFRILDYDASNPSSERDGFNGILLMSRYRNGDNLYYAGFRVDGTSVIKKKVKGTYYTLASSVVTTGTYDRATNPQLLPTNTWIGVRSDVTPLAPHSVRIVVSMDIGRTGKWVKVAEATDSGTGGAPLKPGHAGIRTDFMDCQFTGYSTKVLKQAR